MQKQPKNRGIPKNGEVDVVYIWCDSNHPEYIENKNTFSKEYNINSYWSPTRDHGEISHSIQSVRKHMTWVRNIFVCAPEGHRIKGIDEKQLNVHYITNEHILGKKNCPNFNSHTLELFIHKIDGLSDYYIQFMDDLFINEEVTLEDFYNFDTQKIKFYYENVLVLGQPSSPVTRKIINDMTNEKQYFWATHSPKMFYKQDIVAIVSTYKDISEYTLKARFRTKKDFQLVYFYGYYLLSRDIGEFIFLQNMTLGNHFFSSLKVLLKKILSENPISVAGQIYLQIFYKPKLYTNKIFSNEKKYSLLHIKDDYEKNIKNINFILENKIKFICLNDAYNTNNQELGAKIMKKNYQYFYKKLLAKGRK